MSGGYSPDEPVSPVTHCSGCGHPQYYDIRDHADGCEIAARTAAWHPAWSRYCLAPYSAVCPLHG